MKARKIISISILLAFSLVLAACQTANPPTQPASGTKEPGTVSIVTPLPLASPASPKETVPTPTVISVQLQADPEKLRGLVIQFWHPWSGKAAQTFADLAYEFNTTNLWGIYVEPVAAGGVGGVYDGVNALLTEQEATPHVVAAPIEQLLAWQQDENIVIDLNPYIFSTEYGLTNDQRNDFQPAFWEHDQVDGRQLGIPAQRTTRVLFYNQSWAEELGFDQPPATSAEFQAQACAAAQALLDDDDTQNDGLGGYITNIDPLTTLSWMLAFEADLPDLDFEKYSFRSDETEDMFIFQRSLFDEDCAWNSRLPEPYEYFANRQALFYSGTLQDLTMQAQTSRRLGNPDQWIILPFPGPEGNRKILTYGPSFGILVASPEEQLASWLFIRWLSVPRNQVDLVESTDALPVSQTAIQMLDEYQRRFPQWAASLNWIPDAQTAPRAAEWRIIRRMLEDLTWQLYQPYVIPSDFPKYLKELDEMTAELFE
ncbi:MAG: extracellular solute-binding protein [Anaerolineaceae bacterium]|nr:extracellular solute-binding protein [Anaerolineaceae bacterium]